MNSIIAQLENVQKSYGPILALNSISLVLRKGEIFGYIGPNGAGKTTTIKILLGLLRVESGLVKLFNVDPYSDEQQSLHARSRIGAMFESPGHFVYATAEKNLEYYARLHGVKNIDKKIAEVLKLVELYERRHLRVETFSRGMSQRLAFARAIIHDSDLLILDEPTSGFDPTGQRLARNILKKLVTDGKTVFLSSHNLPEVEEICTRIAIIIKGRIVVCDEIEVLRAKYGRPVVRLELGVNFKHTRKEEILRKIRSLPYVIKCTESTGELRVELYDKSKAVKLNQYLVSLGVPVAQLTTYSLSLEEIYDNLVSKEGKSNDYKNS